VRAAAGILFVGFPRLALMVRTSYKQHWDIPGGIVEPGETPTEAAEREVKEELGVVVKAGRLLVCENVLLTGKELLTAYIFEGDRLDVDAYTIDGEEVLEASWCSPVKRRAYTQTAPIFRNRLELAFTALATETTVYHEHRA